MKFGSDLEALIAELRTLSEREMHLTLSALNPTEQAEIQELLESRPNGSPSFEALAGVSPWLMQRIQAAQRSDVMVDGIEIMTMATRDALIAAFASLGGESAHRLHTQSKPRNPSLIDRFLRQPLKSKAV